MTDRRDRSETRLHGRTDATTIDRLCDVIDTEESVFNRTPTDPSSSKENVPLFSNNEPSF